MSDSDVPSLCNTAIEKSESDDENEEDYEEIEVEQEPVVCLFCSSTLDTIDSGISHLKLEHDFDFSKLCLDQYSYIKMINYIRKLNPTPEELKIKDGLIPWEDESFLQPGKFEPWLTFDIESFSNNFGDEKNHRKPSTKKTITLTIDEYKEMINKIDELENLLQISRNNFRTFLENDLNLLKTSNNKTDDKDDHQDESYFSTYSHFGIHYDMLSDSVRTNSYRQAILMNKNLFEGRTVLDVGCGTGILSIFASKAGAKTVFAIDQSEIIYHAMDIAESNGIKNIKFIKGRLEDIKLPVQEVDIIISEWMGYFLMFEGMLDSVIYARKNYLSPNGILLPDKCNISIVGYGDVERHDAFVNFWNNVYDLKMECMQKECLKEVSVETCKPEHVLTEPVVVCNLSLMEVDLDYSNFEYKFSLKVTHSGSLTAFCKEHSLASSCILF
ncbi:protein arginine N-methyltransferase 3 isoform X2 [Culicoides brevitarsis]|uniref:protein arginine N-methyltransferase 3 isoform X2 n=1 Tax=Culicoides brevitarsis TaxID=469753 RepID=UPI00307BC2C9